MRSHSALRNQRESPLLRLPAEIRARIFDLLFDQRIHIFYLPRTQTYLGFEPGASTTSVRNDASLVGFHHYAFNVSLSKDTYYQELFRKNTDEGIKDVNHDFRKRYWGTAPNPRPDFSRLPKITRIWRVCRQLYADTRFSLYSKPLFTFEAWPQNRLRLYWGCKTQDLEGWLAMLRPPQRRAITKLAAPDSLCFVTDRTSRQWDIRLPAHPKSLCTRLEGFRVVRLRLDDPELGGTRMSKFSSRCIYFVLPQDRYREFIEGFLASQPWWPDVDGREG